MERSAVLFHSWDEVGIFIIEEGLWNLPGGEAGINNLLTDAAVYWVQNELGAWPPGVSHDLSLVPYVDCDITRYFSVCLAPHLFDEVFDFFRNAMTIRAALEVRCVTTDVTTAALRPGGDVESETVHKDVVAFLAKRAGVDASHHRTPAESRDAQECMTCSIRSRNLRECWECGALGCKDCNFWCTKCPRAQGQYTVCYGCHHRWNSLERRGQIWRCQRCKGL